VRAAGSALLGLPAAPAADVADEGITDATKLVDSAVVADA